MKKILATTDFSVNSWKAIVYALELGQKMNAEVVILNAYTLPYSNQTVLISMKEILKESAEQGLKDVLAKVHNDLKPTGVEISTKAVHGDLLVTIDLMVESEGVDLVVMGTKGATGLKAALLGSNAANVIRNVGCPVIAVPESYNLSPIRHITICADFTSGLENNVEFGMLSEIASVFKSKIQLIHIIDPFEDNQSQRIPQGTNFQQFFPDNEIAASVNYNEDVEEGIREFISDNPTDMLVMIRKNYNFLESLFHRSLTRQLAMHTSIPLFVAHEKQD
jgi:nucleotide-binding universal stress UspA family protein